MKRPSRYQLSTAVLDLAGRTDSAVLAKNLAAYLVTERRVNELDSLMRDVMKIRQDQGVNEVTATSVHALTEDVKQELKLVLTNDNQSRLIINEVTNPSVIGGIRIESATEQLDLTIRGRLDSFKQLVTGKEL